MAIKKLYTIEIILKTEKDLLWKSEDIPLVWINKMYTWWKAKWRKGKRSTQELIIYKNFLQDKIDTFFLKNPKYKRNISEDLFYSIQFDLKSKLKKDWTLNEASISDLDGYIKPIQDAFETDSKLGIERIWKNDRNIKCFLPMVEYNRFDYSKLTINVFYFTDELKSKLKSLLKLT